MTVTLIFCSTILQHLLMYITNTLSIQYTSDLLNQDPYQLWISMIDIQLTYNQPYLLIDIGEALLFKNWHFLLTGFKLKCMSQLGLHYTLEDLYAFRSQIKKLSLVEGFHKIDRTNTTLPKAFFYIIPPYLDIAEITSENMKELNKYIEDSIVELQVRIQGPILTPRQFLMTLQLNINCANDYRTYIERFYSKGQLTNNGKIFTSKVISYYFHSFYEKTQTRQILMQTNLTKET